MSRFDCFVLLAGMRTGSNFLEENLNRFAEIRCHGEAFNPGFLGHEGNDALLGVSRAARDADPEQLLERIRDAQPGLGGFRFFSDHDPRVLDRVLLDPRVAKIVLRRDDVESYVSRKIAEATGQWRLTDERDRKVATIRFDPLEFEQLLAREEAFRDHIRRALISSGQTAFELGYGDIGDVEVLNGIAAFLGVGERLTEIDGSLLRQNPGPLRDKVENAEEMCAWLAERESFGAHFEPVHDAAVPAFVAAPVAPLMFLPLKGGPNEAIGRWLAALDHAETDALQTGFSRKSLRQWKNHNKSARSFTVVTHPVERAFAVFDRYIVQRGPQSFVRIRTALEDDNGLLVPESVAAGACDPAELREAFLAFLDFMHDNLAGRTGLRTDPAWSSQAALIHALADVLAPDMVIRADGLNLGLMQLCQQIGRHDMPRLAPLDTEATVALAAIYDPEIEAAARRAHGRDYMAFGFRDWARSAAAQAA